jgi:hypothetical protein
MKALISPQENNRIAEIVVTDFPIAEPLFWVDCPDDCTTEWTYVEGEFLPPEPYVPSVEENKTTASSLLQATDWTTAPDVIDPTKSNPYLANSDEFIAYRNVVRQYAINPIAGNIDWPTLPTEVWTSV